MSTEQLRAAVWPLPAAAALAGAALAVGLGPVRGGGGALARVVWSGDAAAASALLQTTATASMAAATITFSLSVVALQLSSQQFSPRLLRSFARELVMQAAMAVLVATWVASALGLRAVRPDEPLPLALLAVVQVLVLASALVLVAFVSTLMRRLRADSMMAAVHGDGVRSLEEAYAPYGSEEPEPPDPQQVDARGTLVLAWGSGFVRAVRPDALVAAARDHGCWLRLDVRPGDSVVVGTPVAVAVPVDGGPLDVPTLAEEMAGAVVLGHERTEEQDVAFALRQLVDVAVKAISPGVNDPTTCEEALGYAADLLVRLQGRRLGAQVRRDADGRVRALLPDRDLDYYLDLACAQPRRFGRGMPEVAEALLRLLRDVAATARDDAQRRSVQRQLALVLEQIDRSALLPHDVAGVEDAARRVALALDGELVDAYRDAAGETRSV